MKVLVLGGGVAGLSAAHELIERGFDVEVIESRLVFGGKARSIPIPHTGSGGRDDLPGEHGFRFFPGFYRHLTDTMRRIRVGSSNVAERLVPATRMLLARIGTEDVELPSRHPANLEELRAFFRATTGLSIPTEEIFYFWARALQFVASCQGRRMREYEQQSWWDFIGASARSPGYQSFLARGATRSLVAMRAERASTRTIGTIYFQMLSDLLDPWVDVDRVLDGPTSEVWIDPWVDALRAAGVAFVNQTKVTAFEREGRRIRAVEVETPTGSRRLTADYYVIALPVEALVPLATADLTAAFPPLGRLRYLPTSWMNGIQFFLDRPAPIAHGHGLYLDSPWALTSIAQGQFWDRDLTRYGDGDVRDVLSVVISDWETDGLLIKKPAARCTPDEIRAEVWHQLLAHLNEDQVRELGDARVLHWFLDDAIVYPTPAAAQNNEPLLVNEVGSWRDRPDADVGINNAFLASDYVRTTTDLATMEAANEAARRAVNEIVRRTGRGAPCRLYRLREWHVFGPIKALDAICFELGMRHPLEGALALWDLRQRARRRVPLGGS